MDIGRPELVRRTCACGCGMRFSVLEKSEQQFASKDHEARGICRDGAQVEFDLQLPPVLVEVRLPVPLSGDSKFRTNRRCLVCGGQYRARYPGVCKKCKRHVDYKQRGEEDYTVSR